MPVELLRYPAVPARVPESIRCSFKLTRFLVPVSPLGAIDDGVVAGGFQQQSVEEGPHHLVAIARLSAAAQRRMRRSVEGKYLDIRVDGIDRPHDLSSALEDPLVVVIGRCRAGVLEPMVGPEASTVVDLVVKEKPSHASFFGVFGSHLPVVDDRVEFGVEPVRDFQVDYVGGQVDEEEIVSVEAGFGPDHEIDTAVEILETMEVGPEQAPERLGDHSTIVGDRIQCHPINDGHQTFHFHDVVTKGAGVGGALKDMTFLDVVS